MVSLISPIGKPKVLYVHTQRRINARVKDVLYLIIGILYGQGFAHAVVVRTVCVNVCMSFIGVGNVFIVRKITFFGPNVLF